VDDAPNSGPADAASDRVASEADASAKPQPPRDDAGAVYDDAVLLWRGFHHTWRERNHRMNRLGSYIEDISCSSSPCTGTLVHGASPGMDNDTSEHVTFYTKIAANDVGLQSGHTTFTVTGDENSIIHTVKAMQVNASSNTRDRDRYAVLINGFNFCSNTEAKKPVTVMVKIHDEHYDPSTDTINFLIETWLELDCNTLECDLGREDISYPTRVSYVIVAGDSGLFVSRKDFSREYDWEDDIVDLETISSSIVGDTRTTYPTATIGFSKILFDINNTETDPLRSKDEAQWLIQWVTSLRPQSYDPATGTMDLYVDLHFKAHDGYIFGSYRNAGNAFLQAQAVLLQFRDASLNHADHRGAKSCTGNCRSNPCTDAAVYEHDVSFDF